MTPIGNSLGPHRGGRAGTPLTRGRGRVAVALSCALVSRRHPVDRERGSSGRPWSIPVLPARPVLADILPKMPTWLQRWRPARTRECAACAAHVVPTANLGDFSWQTLELLACARKVDVAEWNDVTVKQIFVDEPALGTVTCVDRHGRTRKQLWPG